MSNFLEHLKRYEETEACLDAIKKAQKALDFDTAAKTHALEDKKTVQNLRGKIVLDPKLDPDPYNLHGLSLSHRLECMGWK